MTTLVTRQGAIVHFLFHDTKSALVWLIVRLYVGYEWFMAGYEKVINSAWVGENAGKAISGFVQGALGKTVGTHPDVTWWYAWFLTNFVQPYPEVWSYVISFGELLVGLGLIVGFLTGVAAFFGMFMNLNYLLAGTVSTNSQLFVLGLLILCAWRVAGWFGFDQLFTRIYIEPSLKGLEKL